MLPFEGKLLHTIDAVLPRAGVTGTRVAGTHESACGTREIPCGVACPGGGRALAGREIALLREGY